MLSVHWRCSSVIRGAPGSPPPSSSCCLIWLKTLTSTPTKRLSSSIEPKMIHRMKKIAFPTFASRTGASPMATTSMAPNMTAVHPSRVDISKSSSIAEGVSSKLPLEGLRQVAPSAMLHASRSRGRTLSLQPSRLQTVGVWHEANAPPKSCTPRMEKTNRKIR